MDESEEQSDLDIKRLSLIDVSFEDDSLFNSPLADLISKPSSEKGSERKSVRFLDVVDTNSAEGSIGKFEEIEQIEEPPPSLELEKTRKDGKYNLRKSLAWDSAFFTSAGVLDPEELSSMIGGTEKGVKQILPGIQEDINRSCDSLTTLDSDTLTLECLEADLFQDIRASIQKSSKASDIVDSSSKKESGVPETRTGSSSKKVESASKDKMKLKAAVKKPRISLQESGKTLKQVSVRPSVSQSLARSRESTSTLHKPPTPKVLSRVTPMPDTFTKRVSLSAKHVKIEKDVKAGTVVGRGAPGPKAPSLGGSRNIFPRPAISSKSSSSSPASTKTELTTSCSSLDSIGSASSSSITKSSMNSIRRKNDTKTSNSSSSSTIVTTPSRLASRGRKQTGSSQLSVLNSGTKLSSNMSPSSSISEWSSESSPSTSTVNQRSNIARASLGTGSCKVVSAKSHLHQVLDSQNPSLPKCTVGNDRSVTSGLLHPASVKPSGLRMPSPKIGFFDGVRSSGRTPNGLSHPRLASSSPKVGAGTINLNGSSNNSNLGRLQPTRSPTVSWSTKTDLKQTSSSTKPRSSLPHQESPNSRTNGSASRNIKSSRYNPNISPKLQSKSSPKTDGKGKDQGLGTEGCGVIIGDSDFSSEKIGEHDLLKRIVGQDTKGSADMKDDNIPPINAGSADNDNSSSKSDVKNPTPSQVDSENGKSRHPYLKTDMHSCYKTDEKEEPHVEEQDAGLINQVGAWDINLETKKELVGNSIFICDLDGFVNGLSKSTTHSPPVASDLTDGLRKPLAEMDSLFNKDGLLDVSKGSTVVVVEKTSLPVADSLLPENY